MKLLQRYILYELLRVFLLLLGVLTVLLVFVGVFREVSESGLGPAQAIQILPYIVPSLMPFTIPATMLLAVCVVYGRISGDQEVTAAKSAGVNALSLIWPALLLGGTLSVCSLVLSDQVIPWAVANIQRTVTLAMEDIFLDLLRTNHQVTDRQRGYSITVMGVEGKKLLMPTFQFSPPGKSAITLQAQEATLEFDLDNHQVWLQFTRGHIDLPGGHRVWIVNERRAFPLPQEISKPKARHMSIADLRREMVIDETQREKYLQRRDLEVAMALGVGDFRKFLEPDFRMHEKLQNFIDDDVAKIRTEIHGRFAMSSSCFFFALLGAPFSILQAKRQFLTSFFLCFVPILLVYYPVVLLMMNLSKMGSADPSVVMWLANALIFVAAMHILMRVLRH